MKQQYFIIARPEPGMDFEIIDVVEDDPNRAYRAAEALAAEYEGYAEVRVVTPEYAHHHGIVTDATHHEDMAHDAAMQLTDEDTNDA